MSQSKLFQKEVYPIKRVEGRKVRSDKKRDVKPTIKTELKDAIYRLSFVTRTPVKDVCESMIDYSVKNHSLIDRLTPYFIRDILINDTIMKGHLDNPRYEKTESGNCERINFRLTGAAHDKVSIFAYALDLNVARICAIMLNDCMHDFKFLNAYVGEFLQNELNYKQMKELEKMMQYITKNTNVDASIASLLSVIVHEVTPRPTSTIQSSVDEFIITNWKDNK